MPVVASSTPAVVPGAAPALAKAGVGGFQTTLNVATFEFGINNFASDLREEDDSRIIQVTQNLAGAGCSAKNNILLLEETGQESQRLSKVFVSLH